MFKGWTLLGVLAIVWLGLLIGDFGVDVSQRDCFTWMDPQQYYGFACDVVNGTRALNDFEVPSIFPFVLVPLVAVDPSVAVAFWVNVLGATLLVVANISISRTLGLRTSPLLTTAIMLCSPLMVGLSRSLYLEFWLTAMVACGFALYLRLFEDDDRRLWIGFSALFYVGILLKMTFPLFFLLPAAIQLGALWLSDRRKTAIRLLMTFVVPGLLAIATVWLFFPRAFAYYLNFGNTAIPIMYLVGPIDRWSFDSWGYYLWVLFVFLLGGLTPFLVLSIFFPRFSVREMGWTALLTPRAILWLWLVGPLLLLVPQMVKEPRHVAPCIVPAIFLIVMAIESYTSRIIRFAGLAIICGLSIFQYGVSTRSGAETPYFLDRPLAMDTLQRELGTGAINKPFYLSTPPPLIRDHWRFNQNIVLVGFDPNEALAISWALWPAVVVDESIYREAVNVDPAPALREFNDLSILSIFDTLNLRCGWGIFRFPLSLDVVTRNADYLFVKIPAEGVPSADDRPSGYSRVFTHSAGKESFVVYANERPDREAFRMLYGKAMLARGDDLSPEEENAIAFDLRLTSVLRGDLATAAEVERLFPAVLAPAYPRREIYYIAGMGEVLHRDVVRNMYRKLLLLDTTGQ